MARERRDQTQQAVAATDGRGGALLFELRGDHPGRILPLSKEGIRIGSAKGNDLVLNERGVAARQLEILPADVGWIAKRTDPGGVAFLNGEPLQEGVLEKGSILTLGETTLRYVKAGETISQEELWSPVGGRQEATERKGTRGGRWGFLLLLAVLAAGAVWTVFSYRGVPPGSQGSGSPGGGTASVEQTADPKILRPLYDRGKDLLAARRWDEAVVVLAGIRDVAPSFLDTESAYQEALRESANLGLLNQGKGLLTEGEIGEARRVLRSIDRQSVYYREMERLIREIEGSSLSVRVRLAEEALAKGDFELARLEAEAILAKEPSNQAAQRILEEARKKTQGDAKEGPRGGREEAKAADARPVDGRKGRAGSGPAEGAVRPAGSGSMLQRALEAYWKGNLEEAVRTLEQGARSAEGDKELSPGSVARKIEEIRTAGDLFEQASALEAQGRQIDALKAWEAFLFKDREISGGRNQGVYFERASSRLARLCYERGKRSFDREDFSGAFFFWHMASAMAPGDRQVEAGRAKLDEMAQELYREGYSLQELNPAEAIRRWKRVLGIVPPDHPYYLKAKQRIEILSGIP